MSDPQYQQIPGLDGPSKTWVVSNQALARMICRYRQNLNPPLKIALSIRQDLEAIFPALETVCRQTCPWCPDPCCVVTKVWYDFIDIIFLHLIEVALPPGPLADRLEDPCRYLTHRGCRLSRLIRPWGCIQYCCPTQRKNMQKRRPDEKTRLERTLNRVRNARYQLEAEFKLALETRK